MPKKPDEIEPIDGGFDEVVSAVIPPPPDIDKANTSNSLGEPLAAYPPTQLRLDLAVEVEREVNGIEMGVLQNGMSFLSQGGLARICGTESKNIRDLDADYMQQHGEDIIPGGRLGFVKTQLLKSGYDEPALFIAVDTKEGTHFAYPEPVCMALLEYYAFEARNTTDQARNNFRALAGFGFQKFIYESLGYTPGNKWKYFQDRVSLLSDSSPDGYFILFSEVNGLVVDLIQANLSVNDKTIPDISVGIAWGKHWIDNNLQERYGERIRYTHNYPSYYPQSLSNPQKPWAYPDAALGEFRRWFKWEYLLTKFPKYILTKAKVLPGGKLEAEKIGQMYIEKQINGPET